MDSTHERASEQRQAMDEIDELLENDAGTFAYYPSLARLTGSTRTGIFLSLALHWTPSASDETLSAEDDWFCKTREEWTHASGLSRSNQETARRTLKRLRLLEEELRGIPARLFFRVNLERLAELENVSV